MVEMFCFNANIEMFSIWYLCYIDMENFSYWDSEETDYRFFRNYFLLRVGLVFNTIKKKATIPNRCGNRGLSIGFFTSGNSDAALLLVWIEQFVIIIDRFFPGKSHLSGIDTDPPPGGFIVLENINGLLKTFYHILNFFLIGPAIKCKTIYCVIHCIL